MSAIKLIGFSGEQPRVVPRFLPANGAQVAQDCRLDNGALTPVRQSLGAATAGAIGDKTILKFNGSWLTFAGNIKAAPGPVDSTRLYYTGSGAPKMRDDAGNIYDLALAGPAGALTATLGGVGAGNVYTRLYVYTWVTSFGEESEPCPASAAIDWQAGNTVTLSGFASVPAGRAITKQRIYRSQTGTTGTYFYLIAERAASNTNYSDTVAVDGFQEALPSADWNPPPAGLSGLVALANGMMAGFVGKSVYFSEAYRPHAWPEKYIQNTESDIVALEAIEDTIFVLTKANPYVGRGSTPDAILLVKANADAPCINARGVANLRSAVCYPTNDGLAVATTDGAISIPSTPLFGRDDWRAFDPSTIIGCHHQGRYVAFYDTVDTTGAPFAGMFMVILGSQPAMIRSSAVASAAYHNDEDGGLYFLEKGTTSIKRYDDPTASRAQQYWKSKVFVMPTPESMGIIKISADRTLSQDDVDAAAAALAAVIAGNAAILAAGSPFGEVNAAPINEIVVNGDRLLFYPVASNAIIVRVYADGVLKAEVNVTNREVRIKGGFKSDTWEIDVTTDLTVNQIVLARTVDELRQVA